MHAKSEEGGWQQFLKLCVEARTTGRADLLFGLFLTLEEKEMVGQRFLIVKALMEGSMTQREIAEKYNVSISQITRGSNALKILGGEFRKFLQDNIKNL